MTSTEPHRPGTLRRILRYGLLALLGLIVAGMTAWGTLFLWYSNIPSSVSRGLLAGTFALGTLASFTILPRRRRTLVAFVFLFALLVIWFRSIPPSNDRDWAQVDAVLPIATVEGSRVEIRNIRNFEYRTVNDFTPRYYDRTFDLEKLKSVDLVTVHWGSRAIAHMMASFGFANGDYVAFSIEMRARKGEPGAMLPSFFRRYELICIAADERDVIRVRTNYREPREQVRIYRTRLPVEDRRKLFLSYVAKMQELVRAPEWYNTITDNCTTGVLQRTDAYKARAHYTWKVLLSGFAADYAYDLAMIDTRMPFPELRRISHVNARAEKANNAPDFSQLIRVGLPDPKPYTMEEFDRPR